MNPAAPVGHCRPLARLAVGFAPRAAPWGSVGRPQTIRTEGLRNAGLPAGTIRRSSVTIRHQQRAWTAALFIWMSNRRVSNPIVTSAPIHWV
jgi:hypothetical protein